MQLKMGNAYLQRTVFEILPGTLLFRFTPTGQCGRR